MKRFLAIILLVSLQFACKNKPVNDADTVDKTQASISQKNVHTLEGAYTMNFADGEQTCTLNYEEVDENFVHQFDKEKLQSEQLYCKSNQNLELFCGEDQDNLIWHGSINKNGKAKLASAPELKKDFKNALLQELPEETSYNSVVLDFNLILDFLQEPTARGQLQLNYQIPYELQTLACKTTLPFTLNKQE
ncbi:MAG TPA: hypothetical protein PKC21_03970 [Oligoflexia bacterium]|nr:hypothetical protein [Oligoflexia bacterium]HMR24495.1 hypothetical protein [Oligoflexia bacterium]